MNVIINDNNVIIIDIERFVIKNIMNMDDEIKKHNKLIHFNRQISDNK